jgi:putative hydrolase of the HAD superfamily
MAENILDKYSVILLDMNSTFMFNEDRFGDSEDFFKTYTAFGGYQLDAIAVNFAIRRCYEGMLKDYEDPSKIDDFPSIVEGLQKYAAVDEEEIPLLEAVFTHHERGKIPAEFANFLRQLSRTHRLGLVSNIWAKKACWLAEFEKSGIHDIWDTMIFSSDGRSMKPSPALFRQAIEGFTEPLSKIVFIDDSLRADIIPAKYLGLDTIWINPREKMHPYANYVISSLLQLTL